jgi:lysozyme
MKYSRLDLTERFEGLRLKAYQDSAGIWTIGYGHTGGVSPGDTCTGEQAEQWLAEDVKTAEDAVNRLVKVPLAQDQFDALVDFVYNVGEGNFAHSTMLRLLNAGDHQAASQEFVKWDLAGGVQVAGLLRRRMAEQEVFRA